MITVFNGFFKQRNPTGLRKFTFGFNWIEFTHDALIMYQAMTCGFTLTQILYFCKV